ncbi:hypothetical protein H261_10219 [Paramagnetospirillum caucaseum]|uniref:Uncharacterized protein n=1 Tax=Paramagnetospirillum caucaseum TaxID=1244869 RepID=M3AC29_9PROT|nr:hypothetical protein [Paramagnetospirillum caucaseum]EME70049.1 hypothetical protein H261_10219 [Paramagnetospirillum caucaseum]
MAKPEIFRINLNDSDADSTFRRFTAAICGETGHGRHAVLTYGADGPRCLLQNSGRCLDADTPWRMTRDVLFPVLTFDDGIEWVALFPMDDWQMRCDAALQSSFTDERGRSWSRLLADELLTELPGVSHLIVSR